MAEFADEKNKTCLSSPKQRDFHRFSSTQSVRRHTIGYKINWNELLSSAAYVIPTILKKKFRYQAHIQLFVKIYENVEFSTDELYLLFIFFERICASL